MKKRTRTLIIVLAVIALLLILGGLGLVWYLKTLSPRTVISHSGGPNIHVEELSFFDGMDKIYGNVYMPQDTNGRKPVLICCPGIGTSSDVWKDVLTMVAKKGFIGYTFDFRGGFPGSRSAGRPIDMSINTEKADLEFVLKRILKEDFTDKDHVYLMGHSQGGLIAALVGAGYRREVAGMVLVAPAFNIPEMADRIYPRARDIPDSTFFVNMYVGKRYMTDAKNLDPYKWLRRYKNDVMIIHGTKDDLVPIEYSELANLEFKNSTLEKFEGVGHKFEGKDGSRMREMLSQYLDKQMNK